MDNFDYPAIGQRIKQLRKRKGLNQTELAQMLKKSLRTVQKYETGEIEVSIAVVNQIADLLDTTSTYILGYESSTTQIRTLADVMDFLFKLETVEGIDFKINVQKPPRSKQWECSVSFDGKSTAEFNADMCLFLEQWEDERSELRAYNSTQAAYKRWKEQTLAYYAANAVKCTEPEELDRDELIARRTELLETIFGTRTRAAGRIYYNGRLMNFENPKQAMEHGFAMITEERKANGLFLKGDLTFNTTISNLNHYKNGNVLSDTKMVKATSREIRVMHTKCMGPEDSISSLSGGNQQKVIFGKWLERDPKVFLMDDPTRGIDVGAKYEIYELIIQMAKQGKTIIVVSSEMPEILGITNRIGVMSNGHLAGIVNTKETNQEELLRLSAKYL